MTHQQALESMAAERYLLGEMTELERHRFEAHFFECSECAEDVRIGELLRHEVRTAPTGAAGAHAQAPVEQSASGQPRAHGRAARVLPFTRRGALPWAAAAALALVVGYQSLVTVPSLRETMAAQPLTPVVLHEASRGALPTVNVPREHGFVTLAMDVDVPASARRMSYSVRHAGGGVVAAGEADAPAPGTPFMLLVPADEIRDAGEYIATVTPAPVGAGGGAEFRFEVAAR